MPTKSKTDSMGAISRAAIMLIKAPRRVKIKMSNEICSGFQWFLASHDQVPISLRRKVLVGGGGGMGCVLLAVKADLQGPSVMYWDGEGNSINPQQRSSPKAPLFQAMLGLPRVRPGSMGASKSVSPPPTHFVKWVWAWSHWLASRGYFNQHS